MVANLSFYLRVYIYIYITCSLKYFDKEMFLKVIFLTFFDEEEEEKEEEPVITVGRLSVDNFIIYFLKSILTSWRWSSSSSYWSSSSRSSGCSWKTYIFSLNFFFLINKFVIAYTSMFHTKKKCILNHVGFICFTQGPVIFFTFFFNTFTLEGLEGSGPLIIQSIIYYTTKTRCMNIWIKSTSI